MVLKMPKTIKELIKEVESLNDNIRVIGDSSKCYSDITKLEGIKQTAEAVNDLMKDYDSELPIGIMYAHWYRQSVKLQNKLKDWQTLNKLLGLKWIT